MNENARRRRRSRKLSSLLLPKSADRKAEVRAASRRKKELIPVLRGAIIHASYVAIFFTFTKSRSFAQQTHGLSSRCIAIARAHVLTSPVHTCYGRVLASIAIISSTTN